MTTKRTPEEILASIEEASLDEEIDRVLAMTPAERRAELEAAGFDMKEVHAQADAVGERLAQAGTTGAPPTKVEPPAPTRTPSALRPRWRRRLPELFAAAVAAVTIGGGFAAYVASTGLPARGAPDAGLAAEYRRHGLTACAAQRWQRCLEDLDRARALDPDGDRGPAVQQAREQAAKAGVRSEGDR